MPTLEPAGPASPVVEHRVEGCRRNHGEQPGRNEQEPADRISRLLPRDDDAHESEHQDDHEQETVEGRAWVARDHGERRGRGDERQDSGTECDRGSAGSYARPHDVCLAQIVRCAGSTALLTASSSPASIVSSSTAPRSRAAKSATVASAS